VLDGLASRGYALALYDLPGSDFEPELLELFGTVEIDLAHWTTRDVASAVKLILAGHATPLAVGLSDHAAYEAAKELGFALFSGKFFNTPRMDAVRDVPVAGMSTLVSLVRLQGDKATVEELERVIDHDVGLSVKLLRYINSAYFGMRSRVTSIRQAVMMLGARGVSRWAMMVALTGGTAAPTELSLMALTRARMCELLAAGRDDVAADEMFTIGLLSLADALLDAPLERVVAELPLADVVVDALLLREGPAGAILEAVTSYEIGSFGAQSVLAHGEGAGAAYLEALRWAQDTVNEIS
jgi:EAL and modified HD-GYP domain-containing signal transduction protein